MVANPVQDKNEIKTFTFQRKTSGFFGKSDYTEESRIKVTKEVEAYLGGVPRSKNHWVMKALLGLRKNPTFYF